VETWSAIDSLRVVRTFAAHPLEPAHLARILAAARRTGSSKNGQDWQFIVVRDRARLEALSKVGPYAGHLAGAAAAVALVAPTRLDRWDLGRAAQDMMLAAWELGIGSVPATVYESEMAARLLQLPADQDCHYLISFGYPADETVLTRPNRAGGRKPLAELVFDERWGQAWADAAPEGPETAFDPPTLAKLDEAWEVDIETRAAPDASAHRTTIWIVVEDGEALIRTFKGPRSRWYREALARPSVGLYVGDERLAVRIVPAASAQWVARCSFALARKYARDPSMPAMVAPDVLETTLRLMPEAT
jgi:nitroreductase